MIKASLESFCSFAISGVEDPRATHVPLTHRDQNTGQAVIVLVIIAQ
jgi:hypothetical protein